MGMFSSFADVLKFVVAGAVGGVSVGKIALDVLAKIPQIILDVGLVGGASPIERIQEMADEIRDRTGVEETAVDLIHDMTPEAEEKLFNAVADILSVLGRYAYKDPAFFSGQGEPDMAAITAAVEKIVSIEKVGGGKPLDSGIGRDADPPSTRLLALIDGLRQQQTGAIRITAQAQVDYLRVAVLEMYRAVIRGGLA